MNRYVERLQRDLEWIAALTQEALLDLEGIEARIEEGESAPVDCLLPAAA